MSISIPIKNVTLQGELEIPSNTSGIVLFAHGSGSSRLSPRNQYVAKVLREHGIATLLFDLLTQKEEQVDDVTAKLRFDIPMLSQRLEEVTDWIRKNSSTKELSIGYFGASTGAAAALIAASKKKNLIKAVVSRGGRPDLAGDSLKNVTAPTLLIVGGNDLVVIDLNEKAYQELTCEKKLSIIPGATHLFEEKGALEKVANEAALWFKEHL
ncbi:MAG TPA: alpha/beta family hydrolase [Chlamydiales bacterium]|nr:alpha/beta family hydrolase [Chlamydiales bacterium]